MNAPKRLWSLWDMLRNYFLFYKISGELHGFRMKRRLIQLGWIEEKLGGLQITPKGRDALRK